MKRALVSVFDKSGIAEFVRQLVELGFEIVSTGQTSKALREAGIPIVEVSQLTGFPEILEGRVKTLHPRVHAGILADQKKPEHLKTIAAHGIQPFDLVVVNLYPFEKTVQEPNASFEQIIEMIDIGGPALIRAAAKNHESVAIIVDPADYERVLTEFREKGAVSVSLKQELAAKAFCHTAYYDSLIASVLGKRFLSSQWPETISFGFKKLQECRYGENPHQRGAIYKEPLASSASVVNAKQLQGKEMSFNNFLDANAAVELCQDFSEPCAAIVKHGNPCGIAVSDSIEKAFDKALECDPVSAFGGIIVANRPCTAALAQKATSFFNEIFIAPSFDANAFSIFQAKKNLRVLELPALGTFSVPSELDFKAINGGVLLETRDFLEEKRENWKVVSQKQPSEAQWKDLEFAWKVVKHVKSNAIILVKEKSLVGIGAGQMSRIDSTEIAIKKSNGRHAGAVLASDAFFPFRDNLDLAAKNGITAVIHPGGSIKDEEVIVAANEHGIPLVFTGVRNFRH